MRKFALVLICGIALAGCGGDRQEAGGPSSDEAPTTTTTTTTTVLETTTTTVDPMVAAQSAYYSISAQLNVELQTVDERFGEEFPWSETPAYCQARAETAERFVGALKGYTWPATVQPQVDRLIATNAAEAGHLYNCAQSEGTAEALTPLNDTISSATDAAGGAASELRVALGLPIVR